VRSLEVIKNICADAIEPMNEGEDWRPKGHN
jgi:hypothetical protein